MLSRPASLVIFLGFLLVASAAPLAAGPAEDAAAAYDRGTALLQGGNFDAALEAYGEASRLDPANETYRSEEAILRRVITLRGELAATGGLEMWNRVAPGLRAYYYGKGLPDEALALDRAYHENVGTPATAGLLGESLLQTDRDAEAVAVLSAIGDEDRNEVTRLLLGVALARTGDVERAQQIAASVKVPADAMPGLQVLRARLLAGVGATDGALEALRLAFEGTPPSMLAGVKENVRAQRDFTTLAASAGFTEVLATESKVKQSSCSGGTSCGACPSRTSCGASGTAAEKEAGDPKAHPQTGAGTR